MRKISEEIFDYPDTARRALGPHWTARTPEEQREFVQLFADLLDRAYFSRIDRYQGEKVRYGAETINGNEAIVKTMIVTRAGSEVPVDYRMHLADGRWLVYDVNIEGVSLVSNYRTQFNKIVQTESYQSWSRSCGPRTPRRRQQPLDLARRVSRPPRPLDNGRGAFYKPFKFERCPRAIRAPRWRRRRSTPTSSSCGPPRR